VGKRQPPTTRRSARAQRRLLAAGRRAAVGTAESRAVRAARLTSGALGKLAENLVWEAGTLGSDGELVFYTPVADNEGTDFLVKRRHRRAVIKLQVKGRKSQRKSGAFEVSIDAATIPPSDPKSIVVVHFPDAGGGDAVTIWVIPSADFARLSSFSADQYQALLSPAPTSRDRWIGYRHRIPNLAGILGALLDEARAGRGRRTGQRGAAVFRGPPGDR